MIIYVFSFSQYKHHSSLMYATLTGGITFKCTIFLDNHRFPCHNRIIERVQ